MSHEVVEAISGDPLAQIVDLRPPGAFLELSSYYGGSELRIVEEVFAQAYGLGAQMAVIEYHYVDPDMSSERGHPPDKPIRDQLANGHRVHFFSEPPTPELDQPMVPYDFGDLTYLGHSVFRPRSDARVGRTLLCPPPDLESDITCRAECDVNLFGHAKRVCVTPYMAVDPITGGRAPASLWMAAYFHCLAYAHRTLSLREVVEALSESPSVGHSIAEMAEGSRTLGLPALIYDCSSLPEGESVSDIACRYLNSGMPLLAVGHDRSVSVLIGYRHGEGRSSHQPIQFIYHDGELGPHQIADPLNFEHSRMWEHLIVPLPESVVVTGEVAQELGEARLRQAMESSIDSRSINLRKDLDRHRDDSARVTFRAVLIRSHQFKATAGDRGASTLLESLYRRLPMPRWVWVVEAVRQGPLNTAEDGVLAEIVLDATDVNRDTRFLALHIPGEMWSWLPSTDDVAIRPLPQESQPYESVLRYVTSPTLSSGEQ